MSSDGKHRSRAARPAWRNKRGKITSASDCVLEVIARAQQLDDAERTHLFDLFRPSSPAARTARPALRESLQRMLDSIAVPAVAYNARQDIVGTYLLGRAMFAQAFESDRPNLARYIFLDPRSRDFFRDWDLACSLPTAMIRYTVGRDPLKGSLTALVGELSALSPEFRSHWAARDVHEHRHGRKAFCHREVGELEADYDVLDVPGEPGLSLTTYTAPSRDPDRGEVRAAGQLDRQRHRAGRVISAAPPDRKADGRAVRSTAPLAEGLGALMLRLMRVSRPCRRNGTRTPRGARLPPP